MGEIALEPPVRPETFVLQVHQSLDLRETAFRIANDGRLLLGCDRVGVAVRRGARQKMLAISGVDHVNRRSEVIARLERLCRLIAESGQPLWQNAAPAELAPPVAQALSEYLEVSPARWLAVIPLSVTHGAADKSAAKPSPADATLVFENFSGEGGAELRERISQIVPHCATALRNSLVLDAIPATSLWLALGRRGPWKRPLLRLALAAILLGAAASLAFVQAELEVKARGELQPVIRHDVFAPRDGLVSEVLVAHGHEVNAGAPLLTMRSPELDLEVKRVSGERETSLKELAATKSERLQGAARDADQRIRQSRLTAEEGRLEEQVRGLKIELEMLEEEQRRLTLTAPIDGEVLTWNTRQRLAARPLRRGDAVLTVADVAGPWQLELRAPSRRVGHLLAAQRASDAPLNATFVLTTNPGTELRGQVKEIGKRVEIDEDGETFVLVIVEIDRDEIASRLPGAAAVARIACGQSPLGYVWFHELWDALRLGLLF